MGVANVELWWPRGAGGQPLYDAVVALLDHDGRVLDENKTRIGIRTVELHNTEFTSPEKPGDFSFLVNGEKIFMKGTNWIPLDTLHSRDRKLVEEVFPMVVDLNCNMIRCWGGNVYESDRFFDLCDENGVLVWQEFCLGNTRYPQTDAFFAAMREEAEGVIPRLRNHPSLAHWCGGSECDIVYCDDGGHFDPNTDNRLPASCCPNGHQLDPYRDYHPDSPRCIPAGPRSCPTHPQNWRAFMPERHYWSREYFKNPSYTDTPTHFVSEIGYHGCPCAGLARADVRYRSSSIPG